MASLEGSIGSIGGFCVGASVVIEHQRLSGLGICCSFIYYKINLYVTIILGYCFSASLPPFLSQVAIYILDKLQKNPEVFEKLQKVSRRVDEKLQALPHYEVISDPLSPLKVLTVKEKTNVSESIQKIHSYVCLFCFLICFMHNFCWFFLVRSKENVLNTMGRQFAFAYERVHGQRRN